MLSNIIKTIELNKKNFDEIKGKRFYYCKPTIWLYASFLFIAIGFIAINYCFNIYWALIFLFFLYQPIQMFHLLIYKNPILIIDGNKLFYTKDEKWYDLSQCKVSEYIKREMWHVNYSGTLRVKSYDSEFDINYWFIEDDVDLRKIMSKYYIKNNYC